MGVLNMVADVRRHPPMTSGVSVGLSYEFSTPYIDITFRNPRHAMGYGQLDIAEARKLAKDITAICDHAEGK
jgi:hypothetical protein